MHLQYCSRSTQSSALKYWNETKFRFLLSCHPIDMLDPGSLYAIFNPSLCLIKDTLIVLAWSSDHVLSQPFPPLGGGEAATDAALFRSLGLV